MEVLVRRYGTLIDVTTDGRSGTPETLLRLLTPHLVYSHKTILRGHDAYDSTTGRYRGVETEDRYLYDMVAGRLTTGYGFIPLIGHLLRRAGHIPHFTDVSPPRARPDCYTPDWAHLYDYIKAVVPEDPKREGHFRPRQEECLSTIIENQGGVIDAVTGFGKTFLVAMLGRLFPKAKIHIVIKSVDVAARIVRELTAILPSVGQIGGGKNYHGRVMVVTADSLHKSDGDADFLFCDEAHQLMATTYSTSLGSVYRFSRNYAFTATPEGRLDGAHAKLQMFFGPTIFQLGYPEAVRLELVAPIFVRWLLINAPGNCNPADGKHGVSRMRWGIWRNQFRNQQIADDARKMYDADTQVLMLCQTIDHAIHLWQCIPEYELCYSSIKSEDFARYKKNNMLPQSANVITPERRNNMRTAFEVGKLKKVIATDVWSTGVDFAPLQVVYRCDARESEIMDAQGPGRVSRIFEGKAYGEVVDCVDTFDKALGNKSRTRRRHYKKREWAQQWPGGTRQISIV